MGNVSRVLGSNKINSEKRYLPHGTENQTNTRTEFSEQSGAEEASEDHEAESDTLRAEEHKNKMRGEV